MVRLPRDLAGRPMSVPTSSSTHLDLAAWFYHPAHDVKLIERTARPTREAWHTLGVVPHTGAVAEANRRVAEGDGDG